jgi:predicted nuclease of predicted toxin-antitoxin system
VRFLLDQNLSIRLAEMLAAAGHDVVHTGQLGLSSVDDVTVLERAAAERRILVSADTDFGVLLAQGHRRQPSLILFRRDRPRRPQDQVDALKDLFRAVLPDTPRYEGFESLTMHQNRGEG